MCENAGAQQFLCNKELLFATYTDSVTLMGGLQAVAECAKHFPELALTDRPWRTTIDRAPYL